MTPADVLTIGLLVGLTAVVLKVHHRIVPGEQP